MQSIRAVADQQLVWTQNRVTKDEHDLRAGDDLVATLRRHRGWNWNAPTETTTADGAWTFNRAGFWQSTSTIRTAGADADLGRFAPRWTGTGPLNLASGARYDWKTANFWATNYVWRNDLGQNLVRFRSTRGILRMGAVVDITPEGAALPDLDLPLLTVFGYYLLIAGLRAAAAANV